MTVFDYKHQDYTTTCQTLLTELHEQDFDSDVIAEAAEDVLTALCLRRDEEAVSEVPEDHTLLPARPVMDDYNALSLAFEARKSDLCGFLSDCIRDCLRAIRAAIEEQKA